MSERLTWEEITQRYPDEWVLLTDIDEDPGSPDISAARVLFHSPDLDRVDAEAMLRPIPRDDGVFFTGPLVEPGLVFVL